MKRQNKVRTENKILLIPQSDILPNPNQPRKRFDYEELEGLAQSIRANGILQPLIVRQLESGKFELVAGERRLRAARLIGLTKVPCVVGDISETESAVFAVLENLQRQNLDYFEEAEALATLVSDYHMGQDELCKKLGKAQSTLSNKLRLLKLSDEMRYQISRAGLSERHARALLAIDDEVQRNRALSIIIDRHLTVSESESLIDQMLRKNESPKKQMLRGFKDIRIFINTLNNAVDTIRRAGIDADSVKTETDEYVEYIVRIPKIEDNVRKAAT
ncbi:MAG: ParB/RepB/Spo0J family partition protein [Oscillospiraceae bacterium]|nr:ParB/RepB/Spo0J family partition protein [Oscillospiraceae bacterium]